MAKFKTPRISEITIQVRVGLVVGFLAAAVLYSIGLPTVAYVALGLIAGAVAAALAHV